MTLPASEAGLPWGAGPALSGADYSAVELSADGTKVFVLDQLRLPLEETYLVASTFDAVADAIRGMVVRGAPAIGISAAYGMVLAAHAFEDLAAAAYRRAMREAADRLVATRPTAVNLAWAVERALALADDNSTKDGNARHAELAELARSIHSDDVASCRAMGRLGAEAMAAHARDGAIALLTHCNAGALATGGYGTALGVVRGLRGLGLRVHVYADETRPYLQGARLTAWELEREGFEVTVIGDGMAAHCMQRGLIHAAVVGADRIAANGDVANKIGTYGVACLAQVHDIPFFVAAPWSTIDARTPNGAAIPIEERPRDELAQLAGRTLVPPGVAVYNPGFDVTPARLVTAVVTERGVFGPTHLFDGSRGVASWRPKC